MKNIKKHNFKLFVPMILGTIVFTTLIPGLSVYAEQKEKDSSSQEENVVEVSPKDINGKMESEELGTLFETKGDSLIVRHYENPRSMLRASSTHIAKWGKWNYTHIAVSRGVAAGAINTAFYMGIGGSIGMFGIPGWAIGGLLTSAQWTKLGSSPGKAVAKKWDKNKNGWIGFYMRWGYDGAGRKVASEYTTK